MKKKKSAKEVKDTAQKANGLKKIKPSITKQGSYGIIANPVSTAATTTNQVPRSTKNKSTEL